jgi:hypothetical protein
MEANILTEDNSCTHTHSGLHFVYCDCGCPPDQPMINIADDDDEEEEDED